MAKLRLEIVTPDSKAYSEDVDSVVIPGSEGELGILPEHSPLMTLLNPGELRVLKDGQELRLAVGEGFVEVTPDKVAVLTDMAIDEANIDETLAEKAMKNAEEALKNQHLGAEEHAALQAMLKNSLAQLRVKRRRHV